MTFRKFQDLLRKDYPAYLQQRKYFWFNKLFSFSFNISGFSFKRSEHTKLVFHCPWYVWSKGCLLSGFSTRRMFLIVFTSANVE